MNSSIDEFLDEVDQWKFKVHDQLKDLTPKQRAAFWARFGRQARQLGLRVVQPDKFKLNESFMANAGLLQRLSKVSNSVHQGLRVKTRLPSRDRNRLLLMPGVCWQLSRRDLETIAGQLRDWVLLQTRGFLQRVSAVAQKPETAGDISMTDHP